MPAGKGPFPQVVLIHGGCWTKGYSVRADMEGVSAGLFRRPSNAFRPSAELNDMAFYHVLRLRMNRATRVYASLAPGQWVWPI